MKKFRSDGGGEFVSTEFNDYLKANGIERDGSVSKGKQGAEGMLNM